MVARGNKRQHSTNSDSPLNFWDYQSPIMGVDLKIRLKLQITHYHPLNQWLLGATNGNQGQTVTHLQSSETINRL